MDSVRQQIANLLVVCLPPLLLYWFLVHPWVGFWRRVGRRRAFLVVGMAMVLATVSLIPWRDRLRGADLGTRWPVHALGLVLVLAAGWLRIRIGRHLDLKTLVGWPEVAAPDEAPGVLITGGLYARIRHPRYLQLLVSFWGWALIANHAGAYGVAILWIPGVWAVVLLEERELRRRFGVAYETYCRSVPRFVPGWRPRC